MHRLEYSSHAESPLRHGLKRRARQERPGSGAELGGSTRHVTVLFD